MTRGSGSVSTRSRVFHGPEQPEDAEEVVVPRPGSSNRPMPSSHRGSWRQQTKTKTAITGRLTFSGVGKWTLVFLMMVLFFVFVWGNDSILEQAPLLSTIDNTELDTNKYKHDPPKHSETQQQQQQQQRRNHLHRILSIARARQEIPPLLIMTHATNLLDPFTANRTLARHFGDNMLHTIQLYHHQQQQPEQQQQQAPLPVWFLDDTECHTVLSHLPQPWGSFLAKWFQHPHASNNNYINNNNKIHSIGRFRSDLCRIAALYHTGGLYLDVDLQTLYPIDVWSSSSNEEPTPTNTAKSPQFATAVMVESDAYAGLFFQAVLATTAQHAILTTNFEKLHAFWKVVQPTTSDTTAHHDQSQEPPPEWMQNLLDNHGALLGPTTLQAAFRDYMDSSSSSHHANGQSPDSAGIILLWPEELLNTPEKQQARSFVVPISYQLGYGCCCNYVVHNGTHPLFFSRFVDANEYCRSTAAEHTNHDDQSFTIRDADTKQLPSILPWEDPRSNGELYWLVNWKDDIYPWMMTFDQERTKH